MTNNNTADYALIRRQVFIALGTLCLVLSPARAQTEIPGLEGIWYSCAHHEDNFDVVPETHRVLFNNHGKLHSGKYHVEGGQIKFAGRTLVMTNGELDEGPTHWVNGSGLLATHCPGASLGSPATQLAAVTQGIHLAARQQHPVSEAQPTARPGVDVRQYTTIDGNTNLRAITGQNVLWLLNNYQNVHLDEPSGNEKGRHNQTTHSDSWNGYMKGVLRNCNSYQSDARDCARFADWYDAAGPNDNPKRFQALLLACASASHIRGGQRGCGYLGSAFFDLGNTDAARAVFGNAPGCHADDDAGSPVNDCLLPLTLIDNAKPGSLFSKKELVAMGRLACQRENDPTGCQLANMKWDEQAELQRTQNVNAEQDREYAQAQQRAREHRESFNNVINMLQGMAGPNSIQDSANQQAAAIHAIGDANAEARQQAALQRLAGETAQQAAEKSAANQNPPSNRRSGGAGGAESGSAPVQELL